MSSVKYCPSRKRQLIENESLLSIDDNNANHHHNGTVERFVSNEDINHCIVEMIIDNNSDVSDDNDVSVENMTAMKVNHHYAESIVSGSSNNNSNETGHGIDIDEDDTDDDRYNIMNDNDDDDIDDIIRSRDNNDSHVQHAMRTGKSINTILELLDLFPMDIRHKNMLGDYPLHTACSFDNSNGSRQHQYDEVAIKLLEICPEVAQYKNADGLYPLHLACLNHISEDVAMKLIEIYPQAVSVYTRDGYALHSAIYRNQSDHVIKKLVEVYPQALQEKDDDGRYPIHYTICQDHSLSIMKLILNGDPIGLNRRAVGDFNHDFTPFHLACEKNRIQKVQYFIEHRKSDLQINIRDYSGQTALHLTCNDLRDTIVDMLLSHPDIDVNAIDDLNETPLHKIVTYSYGDPEIRVQILQKLLNHSCTIIDHKNNHNRIPFDIIQVRCNDLEALPNERSRSEEIEYQCVLKMIHLLNEYPVQKRWQAFCYHVIQFQQTDE